MQNKCVFNMIASLLIKNTLRHKERKVKWHRNKKENIILLRAAVQNRMRESYGF